MSDAVAVLIALLSSGGVATVITLIADRRRHKAETAKAAAEAEKVEADTASQITAAALSLVEPLRCRIEVLEAERIAQDQQIAELEREVRSLKHEVLILTQAGAAKDGRISKLEEKVRLKDNRILELEKRVAELEAEVARLQQENTLLRGDCV